MAKRIGLLQRTVKITVNSIVTQGLAAWPWPAEQAGTFAYNAYPI
jgi:hypothetical protein